MTITIIMILLIMTTTTITTSALGFTAGLSPLPSAGPRDRPAPFGPRRECRNTYTHIYVYIYIYIYIHIHIHYTNLMYSIYSPLYIYRDAARSCACTDFTRAARGAHSCALDWGAHFCAPVHHDDNMVQPSGKHRVHVYIYIYI